MAKRKVILFEGVEAFCNFIRAHGGGTQSKSGYSLYRVKPPDTVRGGTWLVLFGYHPRRKLLERQSFQRVDVVEKGDQLETKLKGFGPCSLRIRSQTKGRTLMDFITLTPWKTPRPEARQTVVFWLHNADLLTRLVGDSMALKNDRIRYATVNDGKRASSLLVRIEEPSVYLLQLCQEAFAKEITLYYPDSDGLFLPWGHDYPLIDLWSKHARQTPGDAGSWRFFDADGQVKSVAPVRWEDIYDATNFEFDASYHSNWLQDDEVEHRIRLTLRNEERGRPLEPELWMLAEDQRPQLESLLSAVDETDADNLILSIQRDGQGCRWFFLREKQTARKRKYFDFVGKRFASYKGFPNLFLPVECELQPQLRRDQYPQLFELKSGELTLMIPAEEQGQVGRLVRLNERSFKPLRTYIDYLIEGDRELLEDVMTKSVFDFAHYARAPKRLDLLERQIDPKKATSSAAKASGSKGDDAVLDEEGNSRRTKRDDRPRVDEESWEVVPRSELEKHEQEIESRLASDTPTPELWGELLQIKVELKKNAGAALCAVEALWLSEPGTRSNDLRAEWGELIARTAGASRDDDRRPVHVAARIHQGTDLVGGDPAKLDAWLREAIAELRETESQFRVKDRWMLWGELLRHNRDHVEQARVREQVLRQLGVGLSHEEIPDFIRTALMRARRLDEDDGDDLADAASNLRGIEDQIKTVANQDLRQPALAMAARVYSRIGLHDRARTVCEQLDDEAPGQKIAKCLVNLFAREALASIDEDAAQDRNERYVAKSGELATDTAKILGDIEQSLAERNDAENVAEMLSAEHYRDFFPSSGRSDIDPQLEELSDRFLKGESVDVDAAFSIAQGWFEEPDLDQRRLARRTRQLVQGLLTRMQWGGDGPRVVAAFEQLIDRAKIGRENRSLDFYDYLLQAGFAQGLMQLGQETRAAELLKQPIGVEQLALIDTIDVCSAQLTVIESMRLQQRGVLLKTLLTYLTHGVSGHYVIHALRVLDQTIESAVSKDKFAAQKFQHYIDHEEFMIRQRVLSEDFCQTLEPTH